MENVILNLCFGPLTLIIAGIVQSYTNIQLKNKTLTQTRKLLFESYRYFSKRIITGALIITGVQIILLLVLDHEITRLISFILLVGMLMFQIIKADKILRMKMINEL